LYLFEIHSLLIVIVISETELFSDEKKWLICDCERGTMQESGGQDYSCILVEQGIISHNTTFLILFFIYWNSYDSWQVSGYDTRPRFFKTKYFVLKSSTFLVK
jgi:hypothetical protein